MMKTVRGLGSGWHEIPGRHPVHPDNRFCCAALQWTMFHRLEDNLKARDHYLEQGSLADFRFVQCSGRIVGPGVPAAGSLRGQEEGDSPRGESP